MANGFDELNGVESQLRAWDIVNVSTREEFWPVRPEQEEDLQKRGILLFYTASGQTQILCRTRQWLLAVDPGFAAWNSIRDFKLNFCEVEKVIRLEPGVFDSLAPDILGE